MAETVGEASRIDPVRVLGTVMQLRKVAYLVLGVTCVALGTAGVFLPLLPTTPFLLLATFAFARSNKRWHDWLLNHKYLGPYIHAFRDKKGLTVAQKVRIGSSFSILLVVSMLFVPQVTLKAGLAAGWLFWLIVLWRMKTAPQPAAAQD